MNPLYLNDKPGEYPQSYYAATTELPAERPSLEEDIQVDLAIVGAGYTGLSTAIHAAEKGLSVAVVEAHRAGFGASGRNGGQVGFGWNKDQPWLERRFGKEDARKLWDLTLEAKALTRDLVGKYAPEAEYKPGVFQAETTDKGADEAAEYARWLQDNLDFQVEVVNREAAREICRTDAYAGGFIDWDAGHLHPLRYVTGLARGAEAAGVKIFERTEAIGISEGRVETAKGVIRAEKVVLAGNGYLPDLNKQIAERVMPINSFIAATEPLGDRAAEVLAKDIAVADDKFVVNYYRLSGDKRLLFGGRENYSLGFPKDITGELEKRIANLFPQIAGVGIDYHWGGTLGITMHRLPMLRQVMPGVFAAGGFSGHGVALTGLAGKILAEAVTGDAERFDLWRKLPTPRFPGGAAARAPLLTLAMTWYSLRDRLGI